MCQTNFKLKESLSSLFAFLAHHTTAVLPFVSLLANFVKHKTEGKFQTDVGIFFTTY